MVRCNYDIGSTSKHTNVKPFNMAAVLATRIISTRCKSVKFTVLVSTVSLDSLAAYYQLFLNIYLVLLLF